MPIQHEDTCVPSSNPLQCAYYNKDHKIVNMLGYELIEKKPIPAGSTQAVFTGLDGNTDEEYLVEYEGLQTNGDSTLRLKPNGVVSDTLSNIWAWNESNLSGGASDSGVGISISYNIWNHANMFNKSKVFFSAKTGNPRLLLGECVAIVTTLASSIKCDGAWTNTTDNITSLLFQISAGTFSGILRLYRKIPLDGVD